MMVIAHVFLKLETVKNFVKPFCQKRRFGTRCYSQDVKVCQVLAKSPWECIYHVLSSFLENMIWKMSPLVLGKILGCLLTHWPPMASILFKIVRTCYSQFKCSYMKNEKCFCNFLFPFWYLHQILNFLSKNMMVIANVFPKLKTEKLRQTFL